MTILLELCFLITCIAVLSLTFATHRAHQLYLYFLYGLATTFFVCFVLSVFGSLNLNFAGTLVALGVSAVAGLVTYLQTKEWPYGDRTEFLIRFSIVIPAILFVLVVLLRVLHHQEQKRDRQDTPVTTWLQ